MSAFIGPKLTPHRVGMTQKGHNTKLATKLLQSKTAQAPKCRQKNNCSLDQEAKINRHPEGHKGRKVAIRRTCANESMTMGV